MKRRRFLAQSAALATLTGLGAEFPAIGESVARAKQDDSELVGQLVGLSQGFFEVRHRHAFVIPLAILVSPPATGYSARSSTPMKGETDFNGLKNRTDDAGRPLDLSGHAHTVTLTQEELVQLAQGRYVIIDLAKFAHQFYFVANDATLAAVQAARA